MLIIPLKFSRFPELITIYFRRWRRRFTRTELVNLSDRSLGDIGLDPCRPDFDAVKPIWLP